MKTRADLHREIADVCDMIEGTDLELSHCFKVDGNKGYCFLNFESVPSSYEPCLAIVEGKPVFKDDVLYGPDGSRHTVRNPYQFNFNVMSWNPPKPRTVMVELSSEAIKEFSRCDANNMYFKELVASCKKALEEK